MGWLNIMPTLAEWDRSVLKFLRGGQGNTPDILNKKFIMELRKLLKRFWAGEDGGRMHGKEFLSDSDFALVDLFLAVDNWFSATRDHQRHGRAFVIMEPDHKANCKMLWPLIRPLWHASNEKLQWKWRVKSGVELEKRLQGLLAVHIDSTKAEDDSGRGGLTRKAKYLSDDDATKYRVYFRSGKAFHVVHHTDGIKLTELTTEDWSTPPPQKTQEQPNPVGIKGRGCYVFTLSQILYVSGDQSSKNDMYHSCYTQGHQIVCGGDIEFRNGNPTYIDNKSGHYKPGPQQIRYVVNHLIRKGCNLSKLKITADIMYGTTRATTKFENYSQYLGQTTWLQKKTFEKPDWKVPAAESKAHMGVPVTDEPW